MLDAILTVCDYTTHTDNDLTQIVKSLPRYVFDFNQPFGAKNLEKQDARN